MKNQNTICIAIMLAVGFALAPVTWANPTPQGGPAIEPAATQQSSAEVACPLGVNCEQLPVISIHSAGNVLRGKTGSFVLATTTSALPSGGASGSGAGGTYVNFKVSGTAVAGVDYLALVAPARIGQSGYGTILVQTLPDPRGSFNRQAYSVVVTLESGPGYALGGLASRSATIWIKP